MSDKAVYMCLNTNQFGRTTRLITELIAKLRPSSEIKVTCPDVAELESQISALKEENSLLRDQRNKAEDQNQVYVKLTNELQQRLSEAENLISYYASPDNMCDQVYGNDERALGLVDESDFSEAEFIIGDKTKLYKANHYGKRARAYLAGKKGAE